MTAGRRAAETAAQRANNCIACKVLLVRILLAARAKDDARKTIASLKVGGLNQQAVNQLQALLSRPGAVANAASQTSTDSPPPTDPEALTRAEALCKRAEGLLEGGSAGRAKVQFEQALALVPNLPRAHTGLGYVALEHSATRTALNHFKQAAARGHPEAYLGLGETYRALDRPNAAIGAYKTYLAKFGRLRGASIARQQLQVLLDAKANPAQ